MTPETRKDPVKALMAERMKDQAAQCKTFNVQTNGNVGLPCTMVNAAIPNRCSFDTDRDHTLSMRPRSTIPAR